MASLTDTVFEEICWSVRIFDSLKMSLFVVRNPIHWDESTLPEVPDWHGSGCGHIHLRSCFVQQVLFSGLLMGTTATASHAEAVGLVARSASASCRVIGKESRICECASMQGIMVIVVC